MNTLLDNIQQNFISFFTSICPFFNLNEVGEGNLPLYEAALNGDPSTVKKVIA